MELGDMVISPEYCNTIEKGDENGIAVERLFRKTYNACVPIHFHAPNRSYLGTDLELFSKYVEDEFSNAYNLCVAEFSKD